MTSGSAVPDDVAQSFGAHARRYDRTRPGYPAGLVGLVLDGLCPGADVGSVPVSHPEKSESGRQVGPVSALAGPGLAVLDVGMGTGVAAARFRAAGCRVTGVEPDERMADVARSAGYDVESATFDAWDPAGRAFDAVVSGQAWHWVRPRAGAAKAASILRDGGRLAAFWNVPCPEPDLAGDLAATYRDVRLGGGAVPWRGSPLAGYEKLAGAALSGIWGSRAFAHVTREDIPWQVTYTTAQWLAYVPTLTWHDRLSKATLATLLEANAEVVESRGGTITVPHTTLTLLATR